MDQFQPNRENPDQGQEHTVNWRFSDGTPAGTNGVNINPDFSDQPGSGSYREGQNTFYAAPQPPQKNGKGSGGLKVFAILLCVILVFVIFVFIGYAIYRENPGSQPAQSGQTGDGDTSSASLEINSTPEAAENDEAYSPDGVLTSEQIATKVMPSVVGVVVYTQESALQNQAYSEGSGIIMSEDGFIITNAHVVMEEDPTTGAVSNQPVDKIEVYLNNDEYCQATLIGVDTRTDLAVIKIEKENLVAAEFGDSTALQVGELAVAIGNPTGRMLSSSFTQGVISGVDRSIEIGSSGYTMDCIQTDAAINPGNSGGALVNKYGQVVGINSSKIAATEYEGIGFAIPIHEAKPVVESLIENGYVAGRVRIGITFQSISQALADLRGTPAGLRVVAVDETTDAYAKGVQAGDIITQLDGQDVITLADVSAVLDAKRPGDSVDLTIYRARDGRSDTFQLSVTLEEDLTGKIVS